MWTHRILLETLEHPINSFWTLTYSDDKLPLLPNNLPTLQPEHLTTFLKRLRKDHFPAKLRYFNVGEYGEQFGRPHYHLALFNFPHCERGVTNRNRRGTCCDICDRVQGIWGQGIVYSGQLESASAAYIAGYVLKKWTNPNDPETQAKLEGRYPEFARMSLRPGIGAHFMPEVASALLTHNLDSTLTDVPTSLRTHARVQPLGRYLTRQLRMQLGRSPDAPKETLQAHKETLRPLREIAQMAPRGSYSETLKALITEVNDPRARRLEHLSNLKKKRDLG